MTPDPRLLEERDLMNTLAVCCGCLELAIKDPDFCFTKRMLEGARNLLIDVFRDCGALEEMEEAAAETDEAAASATGPNPKAFSGKSKPREEECSMEDLSKFNVLKLGTKERELDDENALGALLAVRAVLNSHLRSEDFSMDFGRDMIETTRNMVDDVWRYFKARLSELENEGTL